MYIYKFKCFIFQGYQIQCGTSGRGRIILGDTEGYIHAISKHLDAHTLTVAHARGIIQMQQLKQSPILSTLGVCIKFSL